jgi:hypothetical protein
MANPEQVEQLKQGVASWNAWRGEHPEIQPDLHKAELSGANLSHVNLFGADLSQADLSGANLGGANLFGANLSQAKLNGAHLEWAHLSWANLFGADLSQAKLSEVNLSRADLSQADLSQADLSGTTVMNTTLTGTILTGCAISGISAGSLRLEGATQDHLIITPDYEPAIAVDDVEVAQFISLLLNHKTLRNGLHIVTKRGVLLLGRFGDGGLEVLQALATRLREEKYLPILFDLDRPYDRNSTDRDFIETVKTLAGLSRFIIADLSGPSIPQELYAAVPHFKIPFVPILEAGRRQFAMATDLLEYPWVVRPPVVFASTEELVSLVTSRVIAPAEEKHQARQQLLNELFHDA